MKRELAILLMVVGMAGAFTINGDYAGSGKFYLRDETDSVVEMRGNGSMEAAVTSGNGVAWAGFNFNGQDGKFWMGDCSRSVMIQDASAIAAQMQIDDTKSWAEVSGVGLYEEDAYEAGPNGRPENVFEVYHLGEISVNSTIYAEPNETATTDITEADI